LAVKDYQLRFLDMETLAKLTDTSV
jgi:hypothetical protein